MALPGNVVANGLILRTRAGVGNMMFGKDEAKAKINKQTNKKQSTNRKLQVYVPPSYSLISERKAALDYKS